MANSIIKCEHCGAICNLKDGYCKSCWKKISNEAEQNDFIIDGIGQSELENFIDKNSDRYIDIYKKHEGEKVFLHMNWAAFFFGLNWVLYRKMYKYALIGYIVSFLISVVMMTLFLIPHIEKIHTLNLDIAPYQEYRASGGQTILYNSQGVPYSPEVVKKGSKAEKELAQIMKNIELKSFCLAPIQCVFWGLFGDAIYKIHILKNRTIKKGGTSVSSMIGMRLLFSVIEVVALSPIITFIIELMIG